jgi:hypothetical protein
MAKNFLWVNADGDYEESVGAYEQADFINSSTGVADADKPVKTNVDGDLDISFIPVDEIDHNSLLNYDVNEHRVIDDNSTASTDLWSAQKIDAEFNVIEEIFEDMGEPTGVEDRSLSDISFTNATRTFSITRDGVGEYDIYSDGVKTVINTDESLQISTAEGMHYIYFFGNTLTETTTFDIRLIRGDWVYVASVYWNGTEGFLMDERHGITMDGATHEYLHRTVGTAYDSGLGLSGYTIDTDTDNAITFGVSNGTIRDEDIKIDIVHSLTPVEEFEQNLIDPAKIPVYYKQGASGIFFRDTATNFPYKNTASGRVNYNRDNSGTWGQQELTDGYFTEYWILATNIVDSPIVSFQGQQEFATLNDANSGQLGRLSILLSGMPSAEFRTLYRIVLQSDDTFGGERKAKIVAVEDYRTSSSISGNNVAVTEHNQLTGRDSANAHPALSIQPATGNFNGILSATDTDLQTALDTIDDHNHDDLYYRETEFINSSTGVSDADKPILTNSTGNLDISFINLSDIDHGQISGLGDDDHTQYILVDGSRAFTDVVQYAGTITTDDISNAQDLVHKAYVDSVATGLKPKGDVDSATATYLSNNSSVAGSVVYDNDKVITATLNTTDTLTIDGVNYSSADNGTRVLLYKEGEVGGLGAEANGIYTIGITGTSLTLTRSEDQDNTPLSEVVNGVWIPKVIQGTTNGNKAYVISSVGSGADNVHVLGTDEIIFSEFTSATQLSAGDGIDINASVISVDADDLVGEGLVVSSNNFNIDWATVGADDKAWKASDLYACSLGGGGSVYIGLGLQYYGTISKVNDGFREIGDRLGSTCITGWDYTTNRVVVDDQTIFDSIDALDTEFNNLSLTTNGQGASKIGIEDVAGNYTATTVEGALTEISTDITAIEDNTITSPNSTINVGGTIGADNQTVDVNFATNFAINGADNLAVSASDLALSSASVGGNDGARKIGYIDLTGFWNGDDVRDIILSLESLIASDSASTHDFSENNLFIDNEKIYPALEKVDLFVGDLASTTNGEGGDLVGYDNTTSGLLATNVNEAIDELADKLSGFGITYTVGAGGVAKGDLVYISGANTVTKLSTGIGAFGIGVAKTTETAGNEVVVVGNDTIIEGVLTGLSPTPGDKVWWTNSGLSLSFPIIGGAYVWLVGIAKNANDLQVEVSFIKRNRP